MNLSAGDVVRINARDEKGIISYVEGDRVLVLTIPGLLSNHSHIYYRNWYTMDEVTSLGENVERHEMLRWFQINVLKIR